MLVQLSLCQTCTETILLVFLRGSSNVLWPWLRSFWDNQLHVQLLSPIVGVAQISFTANLRMLFFLKLRKIKKTLKCFNEQSFIKEMSHPMGKPTMCIGENKDADQLRGYRDQRLCFRYSDSTIPLLLKSETSSF